MKIYKTKNNKNQDIIEMSSVDKEFKSKILFWSAVITALAIVVALAIVAFVIGRNVFFGEPVYTFEIRKNFKYGRLLGKPNTTTLTKPMALGLKISGSMNADDVWKKLLDNDIELLNKILIEMYDGLVKIELRAAAGLGTKSQLLWKTMDAKKSNQYSDVIEINGTSVSKKTVRTNIIKDGDVLLV